MKGPVPVECSEHAIYMLSSYDQQLEKLLSVFASVHLHYRKKGANIILSVTLNFLCT